MGNQLINLGDSDDNQNETDRSGEVNIAPQPDGEDNEDYQNQVEKDDFQSIWKQLQEHLN